MSQTDASGKRLVYVGAGHAHMHSLSRIAELKAKGASVTVIGPSPFWYSGMGPGLLSGQYSYRDASVDAKRMVESAGGKYIADKVVEIDPDSRVLTTGNGESIEYDLLSLNIGSEVRLGSANPDNTHLYPVKPVSRFLQLREELLRREPEEELRINIVGGGAAGCEAAAALHAFAHSNGHRIRMRILTADNVLLPDWPRKAQREMLGWCRMREIGVSFGKRIAEICGGTASLPSGDNLSADFWLLASGVRPPELLQGSRLETSPQGAMVVDRHLQSVSHPGVFGGGDCIHFQPRPLDHVGVHAIRESQVLHENLLNSLEGNALKSYSPQKNYLLILNLARREGLLKWSRLVLRNTWALRYKHKLDEGFISGYRQPPKDRLVIFVRYPVAGKTKTRLIPAVGSERAAGIHRRMAERLAATARSMRMECGLATTICFTGASREKFESWLGPDFEYLEQPAGDLGDRLAAVVDRLYTEGARRIILAGTDIPGIDTQVIHSARQSLDAHDIVLGPASDGGYYLLAMHAPHPALFWRIDWGSEHVLEQTRAVIEDSGLSWCETVKLDDIDRPEDLAKLKNDPSLAGILEEDPPISVIVPTLNEAGHIEKTLRHAMAGKEIEVIVADGGSRDETCRIAQELGARMIQRTGGRARQMNAAAKVAQGRILLFLHADTLLPAGFAPAVRAALKDPATVAGAFSFKTDTNGFLTHLFERGTNRRCRRHQTPYGDQAIFMEKRVFEEMGGYSDMPIMEDYEFIRRLRRRGKIALLDLHATTSGRRLQALGVLPTTILNQIIIWAYHCGVNPSTLAEVYRGRLIEPFCSDDTSRIK